MPTVGQVLVAPALRDFVIKYNNADFIGLKAFPIVPRQTLQGVYYQYDRKNEIVLDDARPWNAKAIIPDQSVSTGTYDCKPHAIAEFLPDVFYGADPAVIDMINKAQFAANIVKRTQEQRISTLMTTASNYPAANRKTLSATGANDGWQFDKYADGKDSVFSILETAKATLYRPMDAELVGWMGGDVFRVLRHHPDVLNRLTGNASKEAPAMVMKQTLAEMLECAELLIGDAEYNSTPRRASPTYTKMWGYSMGFFYRAKSPLTDATSFGYTFSYAPKVGERSMAQVEGAQDGWRVRRWHDPETGGGGTKIEVEGYFDEKIVCSDCGVIISSAIGSVIPS